MFEIWGFKESVEAAGFSGLYSWFGMPLVNYSKLILNVWETNAGGR